MTSYENVWQSHRFIPIIGCRTLRSIPKSKARQAVLCQIPLIRLTHTQGLSAKTKHVSQRALAVEAQELTPGSRQNCSLLRRHPATGSRTLPAAPWLMATDKNSQPPRTAADSKQLECLTRSAGLFNPHSCRWRPDVAHQAVLACSSEHT